MSYHFYKGSCLDDNLVISLASSGDYPLFTVFTATTPPTWVEIRQFSFSSRDSLSDYLVASFYRRDLTTNSIVGSTANYLVLNKCTPDDLTLTTAQLPLYSGAFALMFLTAYFGKSLRKYIESFYGRS